MTMTKEKQQKLAKLARDMNSIHNTLKSLQSSEEVEFILMAKTVGKMNGEEIDLFSVLMDFSLDKNTSQMIQGLLQSPEMKIKIREQAVLYYTRQLKQVKEQIESIDKNFFVPPQSN